MATKKAPKPLPKTPVKKVPPPPRPKPLPKTPVKKVPPPPPPPRP